MMDPISRPINTSILVLKNNEDNISKPQVSRTNQEVFRKAIDQFNELKNEFVGYTLHYFDKPKRGDPLARNKVTPGYFLRAHFSFKNFVRVYTVLKNEYAKDNSKWVLLPVFMRVALVVAFPFLLIEHLFKIRNGFINNLEEFGKTTKFHPKKQVQGRQLPAVKVGAVDKFNQLVVRQLFGNTLNFLIQIFITTLPGIGIDSISKGSGKSMELRRSVAKHLTPKTKAESAPPRQKSAPAA